MACEIICADNGRFIETMRKNTNIMSPLWNFLLEMKPRHNMNSKINNSVTGDSPSAIQNGAVFFSRLNIFLFNKMPLNMINFLNERVPKALDLLVCNLDLQPIAELLYRFYALYSPSNSNDGVNILDWLAKGKFYDKLADQLIPANGADLHMATSQFISGLFLLPFPDSFPRDQVLKPFLDPNWLNKLLGNIFRSIEDRDEDSEELEQSSMISGLEIISSILKASREFSFKTAEDYLGDSFITELIKNFEPFYDILKRGNGKTFGRIRLGIVEMFTELFSCLPFTKNCENYVSGFVKIGFLPTLLDAFFHYKENSLLHELVVKMIKEIFEIGEEQEYFDLIIDQLLTDYCLRQRIVEVQRENDAHVQKPRGNRFSCMGHLTQLAESIIKWESEDKKMITTTSCDFVVSNLSEEFWGEYVNKTFKETRLKDRKVLGGIKPQISLHEMISSSEDDSGDELLNYNSVFRSGDEEQLARYFCQQIIGNVPEQFLYADKNNLDDEDDDSEEEEDDEIEFFFESSYNHHHSGSKHRAKSIEIPILLQQDDFDSEMFDNSFTSSLLSGSDEDGKSGGFGGSDGSDDDDYDDYEM